MKASILALAAIAAVASATELYHHGQLHAHLHKKGEYPMSAPATESSAALALAPALAPAKNATCGRTTIWSTKYSEAILDPPAPSSSSAAPPAETYPVMPVAAPEDAPSHSSTSSGSASSSASGLSHSSGSSSSAGTPGYSSSGKNWAMAYSPYTGSSAASSSCKSSSQVMHDVGAIAAKGFGTVRIYATDCHQLTNVAAACQAHGLKMIIGVFVGGDGIDEDTYDQLNEIVTYFHGNYQLVNMVIIGNEAIFNGYCTGAALAAFISHSKTTLRRAGYYGMVTTTDTVAAFQANARALCPVIDSVGANIYSFFNGNVLPSESGSFIANQMQLLEEACPGKEVYNFETGWPVQGPSYMNAEPSPENQAAFVKSVMESDKCGHTVFFTMEHDMWKDHGAPSVEPYFGCLDQFEG